MIQRFTVLAALFPIADGKKADPFGNQIAAGLQARQQQQRRAAKPETRCRCEGRFRHQIQRLPGGAIERRQIEQGADGIGNSNLQMEFADQRVKIGNIVALMQKQQHVAFIKEGVRGVKAVGPVRP